MLLVDVKALYYRDQKMIWKKNSLFTLCGHAILFNAERIFLVNRVAPLSFK